MRQNNSVSLSHPKLFRTNPKYFNFNNFKQLENELIKLKINEDDKGEIFEIFIEAFLKTTKLFNVKKIFASQKNFPNYIFDKLGIPRTDKGIDGIIIDINNKIIPYQVKFRSSKKLDYDELTGFKDQSVRAEEKILFTNANLIGEEYFKRGNNIAFRGVDFEKLTTSEMSKINSIFHKKSFKTLEEKKIDKYQEDAINSIEKELKTQDRTTCLMACGTGKTYVALWYIERVQAKKIIVFVPSIALLKQIRGDWLSNSKIKNLTSFAVCSDKSEPRSFDEIKLKKKDLNFKIDTDPKEIRKFINNNDDTTKIIFTTYHSSEAVKKACKNIAFDIGIFDEAHRTTSFSIKNQETAFNLGLLDKNILIKKRVFFTATQKVFNHKVVDKFGNPKIKFNMNNPSIYGNVCYKLNFYNAHKLNAISDYKIIITETDNSELSEELRKRSITKIKKNRIITDQIAHQVSIKKAIDNYNLSKIFTFHNRIPHAKSFAKKNQKKTDISNLLPNFECNYIEAKMNSIERETIINKFKDSKKALISNARCLIEGVDVPEVDAIAYVSPKKSKIDIVQSLGRAVRNRHNKDKKYGYVIVPIFKEKFRNETISEANKRSQYETIAEVLDALRNQDDALDLQLNEININYKRGLGFFSKNLEQLSEKIIFLENEISINNLKNHIFLKVLESFRNNWDDMIGMLRKYKDKFGHCDVSIKTKGEFKSLAKWIHYIRLVNRRKKHNFLKNNQIDILNKVGFNWKIEGETVEHPNNYKPKNYFGKKYKIFSGNKVWNNYPPKGKYYHAEGGKLIDVYEDDTIKFKKALGIDFFSNELNSRNYTSITEILRLFFGYSNFLTQAQKKFIDYLSSQKIKVVIAYDSKFLTYYVNLSKKKIIGFLKKKKLIFNKDKNKYFKLEQIKKLGIHHSDKRFISKFKFVSIKSSDGTINFVNAYDKKDCLQYSNSLKKLKEYKLNKKVIYIGQYVKDTNGKNICLNNKFIKRYKKFLKKIDVIDLKFKKKEKFIFYKIIDPKNYDLAWKIDNELRKDLKSEKIKKYYTSYIFFKNKQIRVKNFINKNPKILKKINIDFIPLKQRTSMDIFEVINKNQMEKSLDIYISTNNYLMTDKNKKKLSKRLKGKKLPKHHVDKLRQASLNRKRIKGRFA